MTFVLRSKNSPIKANPVIMKSDPKIDMILGELYLSTKKPTNGADSAYTPPLIINITPSQIADNSNCLKCGSNVALINPIDALVAPIPRQHTIMPGILKTCNSEFLFSPSLLSRSLSGKMRSVIIAHVKSAEPSTTKGK